MNKTDVFTALDKVVDKNAEVYSASMTIDTGEFQVSLRISPRRYANAKRG